MASPYPRYDKAAPPRLNQDVWRALSALCEIASASAKTPMAAIFLLDDETGQPVTAAGVGLPELPQCDLFFRYTLSENGPAVIPNVLSDRRFFSSPWVAGPAHVRFHAGVALEPAPGLRLGVLCVMDVQSRETGDETLVSLQQLGQAASAILAIQKKTDAAPAPRVRGTLRTNVASVERQKRTVAPGTTVTHPLGPSRAQIRSAISDGQFVPFYQPKVELKWGRTIGLEVLARWKHPTRGLLAPKSFQHAISSPLITPLLTRTILSTALRDSALWRASDLSPGRLAINVTSADLKSEAFANELFALLETNGFDPRDLVVEVTEGIAMGRPDGQINKTLSTLRSRGVRVVLDDFGTGFASLQHLRHWPVDGLKLDRSFVQDCLTDKEDQIIIRGIVQMCRELQLEIVAEGIETNAQYLFLSNLGCDFGQGYYFSEPVPANEVPKLLTSTFAPSTNLVSRL